MFLFSDENFHDILEVSQGAKSHRLRTVSHTKTMESGEPLMRKATWEILDKKVNTKGVISTKNAVILWSEERLMTMFDRYFQLFSQKSDSGLFVYETFSSEILSSEFFSSLSRIHLRFLCLYLLCDIFVDNFGTFCNIIG